MAVDKFTTTEFEDVLSDIAQANEICQCYKASIGQDRCQEIATWKVVVANEGGYPATIETFRCDEHKLALEERGLTILKEERLPIVE